MTASADVVVIGGGVIGCSCAFFLARDGHRVILVDRGDLGSGTASASGGWVILHARDERESYRLAAESRRLYDVLADEAGVTVLPTGGIAIASDPSELETLQGRIAHAREFFPAQMLDRSALKTLEPSLAPDLAGGLFSPMDAVVDPVQVCRALGERAAALGVQVRTRQPVTAIEVRANRVQAVRTEQERLATSTVVCAAGPWAAEVSGLAGISVPVRPRRGHIIRIPKRLVHRPMLELGYEKATRLSDESRGLEFVIQPTVNGGTFIGSSREFKGFNDEIDSSLVESMSARAGRFVPTLRNLRPESVTVGFRPYSDLERPIIGWTGPLGFLLAAGHEGTGITLGPVTGKMVADLVTRRIQTTGYELRG